MNAKKERILILYVKSGGGHISTARALAKYCEEHYPDLEPVLCNAIPEQARGLSWLFEQGYRLVTEKYMFVWGTMYYLSRFIPPFMYYAQIFLALRSARYLRDIIRKKNITRIINVHLFLATLIARSIRQVGKPTMPVVTVVTDPITCHPIWFYQQFDSLLVYSNQVKKYGDSILRLYGRPTFLLEKPRKIQVVPQVYKPCFDHPFSKDEVQNLRENYGITDNKPILLIAGGGDGLANGKAILSAILNMGLAIHIFYVSGNNKRQEKAVQAIVHSHQRKNALQEKESCSVRVFGYVDFLFDLMNIADIIISKAGPGMVFESLKLKKPLILAQYIYGQERGNVRFVVDNGLGWFISRPKKIVSKIQTLLTDKELMLSTAKSFEQLQLTNGASQILNYVLELDCNVSPRPRISDIFKLALEQLQTQNFQWQPGWFIRLIIDNKRLRKL